MPSNFFRPTRPRDGTVSFSPEFRGNPVTMVVAKNPANCNQQLKNMSNAHESIVFGKEPHINFRTFAELFDAVYHNALYSPL